MLLYKKTFQSIINRRKSSHVFNLKSAFLPRKGSILIIYVVVDECLDNLAGSVGCTFFHDTSASVIVECVD